MARKKAKRRRVEGPRIYARASGSKGTVRHYGDFRSYADVGGGREALCEVGQKRGTTDPERAKILFGARLAELIEKRKNGGALNGEGAPTALRVYAEHHLEMKHVMSLRKGKPTPEWVEQLTYYLEDAINFFAGQKGPSGVPFGLDRTLTTITPAHVAQWLKHLRTVGPLPRPRTDGKPMRPRAPVAEGTAHHFLVALSDLYQRAGAEGVVPLGYNPARGVYKGDKPTQQRPEAVWLEMPEAALLLEAARAYRPPEGRAAVRFMHELVAVALLTGARKSEVLAMRVDDIAFDAGVVTVRGTKSRTSRRRVPLWPQLREILEQYITTMRSPWLFPSPKVSEDQPVGDVRDAFDAVKKLAGLNGKIGLHTLRHTYTAARIQTLDQDEPVALFTIMRELGHSSVALIENTYGHLLKHRRRASVVEFRVEHFEDVLADRLEALRGLETAAA